MAKSRSVTLAEAQKVARDIICDADYQMALKARAAAGRLPPAVETMLWAYGYGKPAEHIDINTNIRDLRTKPLEDLASEAEQLAARIRESKSARQLAMDAIAAAEAARKDEPQSLETQSSESHAPSNKVHFADFASKDKKVH